MSWEKEIKCEACRAFYLFSATSCYGCQSFPKINKPLVVYRFYCMALFHSKDATSYDNVIYALSNSVGRCAIPWEFLGKSVKHIFSCRKMYSV